MNFSTRWGCTGHTENAVCYACAGPNEGPQWWQKFRDFGMLYERRMYFLNYRKYEAIRRQKLLVNA